MTLIIRCLFRTRIISLDPCIIRCGVRVDILRAIILFVIFVAIFVEHTFYSLTEPRLLCIIRCLPALGSLTITLILAIPE